MNELFKRSFRMSFTVHVGLIVLVLVLSGISSCRWFRKPPKDNIMMIDLTVAVPEVPQEAEEAAKPEMKVPEKIPEPVKDIPEPEKTKPKPKPETKPEVKPEKPKIEVSKTKIKRPPDRPAPKPKTPPLSEEEIRKLLAMGARISDTTQIPNQNDFPFAWYYALVRQTMYEAWNPPGSLAMARDLSATVEVRVMRNGSITQRRMTRSSGNRLLDDSIMQAVNSVSTLKPLPDQFPGSYKDITIEFVPTESL